LEFGTVTSETVTEDMKLEASILGQGNDLDGMSRVTLYGVRKNEFHEFHFDGRALSNKRLLVNFSCRPQPNNAERLQLPFPEFHNTLSFHLQYDFIGM
jgi:hypothetical protein